MTSATSATSWHLLFTDALFSDTTRGSAAKELRAAPDQLAGASRFLIVNLLSIPMVILSSTS